MSTSRKIWIFEICGDINPEVNVNVYIHIESLSIYIYCKSFRYIIGDMTYGKIFKTIELSLQFVLLAMYNVKTKCSKVLQLL